MNEKCAEPSRAVLVVEDDLLNTKIICNILTLDGFRVIEAADAETALKMVEDEAPDLVVMDIRLPGMSGIEAVGVLKSRQETRSIPVIALTGYAMKEFHDRCFDAGFDGFLTKPFDAKELIREVRAHLVEDT
jgi:CheY-like chemotaxis protein